VFEIEVSVVLIPFGSIFAKENKYVYKIILGDSASRTLELLYGIQRKVFYIPDLAKNKKFTV